MRAIVSLKPTPAGDYDRREGSSPRPASATAPSRVAPRRCGMVKSPAARYPTSLPVVFSAPETFQPGYAANISAGGMFLRTDGRLAVGALLSVKLELPDGAAPPRFRGRSSTW